MTTSEKAPLSNFKRPLKRLGLGNGLFQFPEHEVVIFLTREAHGRWPVREAAAKERGVRLIFRNRGPEFCSCSLGQRENALAL